MMHINSTSVRKKQALNNRVTKRTTPANGSSNSALLPTLACPQLLSQEPLSDGNAQTIHQRNNNLELPSIILRTNGPSSPLVREKRTPCSTSALALKHSAPEARGSSFLATKDGKAILDNVTSSHTTVSIQKSPKHKNLQAGTFAADAATPIAAAIHLQVLQTQGANLNIPLRATQQLESPPRFSTDKTFRLQQILAKCRRDAACQESHDVVEENQAAILIQSRWRGHQVRKEIWSEQGVATAHCAIAIQRLARGWRARQTVKSLRKELRIVAATRIAKWYRVRRSRALWLAMQIQQAAKSISKLQRRWRGRKDRKLLEQLRLDKKHRLATVIQTWFRAVLARRRLMRMRQTLSQNNVALLHSKQTHMQLERHVSSEVCTGCSSPTATAQSLELCTFTLYVLNGNFALAATLFERAVRAYPQSPVLHFLYAVYLAEVELDFERSLVFLMRALELDPGKQRLELAFETLFSAAKGSFQSSDVFLATAVALAYLSHPTGAKTTLSLAKACDLRLVVGPEYQSYQGRQRLKQRMHVCGDWIEAYCSDTSESSNAADKETDSQLALNVQTGMPQPVTSLTFHVARCLSGNGGTLSKQTLMVDIQCLKKYVTINTSESTLTREIGDVNATKQLQLVNPIVLAEDEIAVVFARKKKLQLQRLEALQRERRKEIRMCRLRHEVQRANKLQGEHQRLLDIESNTGLPIDHKMAESLVSDITTMRLPEPYEFWDHRVFIPRLTAYRQQRRANKLLFRLAITLQTHYRRRKAAQLVTKLKSIADDDARQQQYMEHKLAERKKYNRCAAKIQAMYKGHTVRKIVILWHKQIRLIQSYFRRYRKLKQWYAAERRRREGAEVKEIYQRGHIIGGRRMMITVKKCGMTFGFIACDVQRCEEYSGMLPAAKTYAMLYYDGIRKASYLLGKPVYHLGQEYIPKQIVPVDFEPVNYDNISLRLAHAKTPGVEIIVTLAQAQEGHKLITAKKRGRPGVEDPHAFSFEDRLIEPQIKGFEDHKIIKLLISLMAVVPQIKQVTRELAEKGDLVNPHSKGPTVRRVLVVEAPLGSTASDQSFTSYMRLSRPIGFSLPSSENMKQTTPHSINGQLDGALLSQGFKQPLNEATIYTMAELYYSFAADPALWETWKEHNKGVVLAAQAALTYRKSAIYSVPRHDEQSALRSKAICPIHSEDFIHCNCHLPETSANRNSAPDICNPRVLRPRMDLLRQIPGCLVAKAQLKPISAAPPTN